MKYVILNDSTLRFENYGISDIEDADTINLGGVATLVKVQKSRRQVADILWSPRRCEYLLHWH
jgi:hypothetical protein